MANNIQKYPKQVQIKPIVQNAIIEADSELYQKNTKLLKIGSYKTSVQDGVSFPFVSVSSDYEVKRNDYMIFADATSASIDITLPNLNIGKVLTIKKTDSSSNTVDIVSTFDIDGSTTYQLSSQYNSVTLFFDGNNFFVISTV